MHIDLVTIVVDEYDSAIAFFVDVLGFDLVQDAPSWTNDGRPERWVVVRPPGAATGILLARAGGPAQVEADPDPTGAVQHGATLTGVPTSHPRHSITETPALRAVLESLRQRLGTDMPSLAELVRRGAETTLREIDQHDRARNRTRATFVDRLSAGPAPNLQEFQAIRHSSRR